MGLAHEDVERDIPTSITSALMATKSNAESLVAKCTAESLLWESLHLLVAAPRLGKPVTSSPQTAILGKR
ncbi:hypothetical protein LOAG_12506 [Loa loa]|uniref:Uncharacterized protein n=1 Tax=Loa loa TaxID=7209 RepID=A0A1S0TL29_LOALO|nr:hypothetical protein LOAG_12506 [Loa loa]EFO16003.1 hypothetical protein LOAG_12506 [Loa loa]